MVGGENGENENIDISWDGTTGDLFGDGDVGIFESGIRGTVEDDCENERIDITENGHNP